MRHSGPLQDLPIEHFLPPDPNIPHLSTRPSKRPLSPGVSKLLSPAKRRVLNEEGLLLTGNKESTISRTPKQSSLGRFADVLGGPGSPAKVLDFGLPKNLRSIDQEVGNEISITPRRPVTRSMTKLAPPPELNCGQGSSRHKEPLDDMFDPQSARLPLYLPRDPPPPPDPQSVHYPGFEIHRDPYFIVFPPVDVAQLEDSKDEVKENVPCRLKSRKASDKDKAESRARSASQEPANEMGSNKLSSSKNIFAGCATPTLTSRRLGIGSLHVNSTGSNSRTEEGLRKLGKMKMLEEIDETSRDDEEGTRPSLH